MKDRDIAEPNRGPLCHCRDAFRSQRLPSSPQTLRVAGPQTATAAADATCSIGGPQWPRCHRQSGLHA